MFFCRAAETLSSHGAATGPVWCCFSASVLYPSIFAAWGMSTAAVGLVLSCLPAGFALAAVGANVAHLRASDRQRVAVGSVGVLVAVLANVALVALNWPGRRAAASHGAFLGLVIPANNAAVMAAVPAGDSAVTGWHGQRGTHTGTALGVSITAMSLRVAYLHQWVGPQVMLSALAVCSVVLAATTLSWRATTGNARAGCGP
jgi:hypothetical protein